MALDVIISKEGSEYSLKVSRIEHTFNRLVSQTGLPGEGESNSPNVFLLDLGVCTERISLIGVVDESTSPTKYELETVAREWWAYGDADSSLCTITLPSSQSYRGAIQSSSFTKEGGIPSKWDFSVIFLIKSKVS